MKKTVSSSKNNMNMGVLTVVTGTIEQGGDDDDDGGGGAQTRRGRRVVAVQVQAVPTDADDTVNDTNMIRLSESVQVHADSVAAIPDQVSDQQAAATYSQAISWHTAWEQAVAVSDTGTGTNVANGDGTATEGGTATESVSKIKAVVVGGSAYATTAAAALAALGASVTMVSTGSPNLPQTKNMPISALQPASGELQLGFCNVVGQFDLLLDTLGNERDEGFFPGMDNDKGSMILRFLGERHDCRSYVSTVTAAQTIVARQGVLWGPGKAKTHVQTIQLQVQQQQQHHNYFVPPARLGRTVQTILQAGVVASTIPALSKSAGILVREWSLPDYWELVTWPRDSAGGANVRYGFPVPDDLSLAVEDGVDSDEDEDDDESSEDAFMVSAPPLSAGAGRVTEERREPNETPDGSNPYILNVVGVQGLQKQVIEAERDCLLFLSAPFCRTCRYLEPQYQRMARKGADEWDGAVTFAKADAAGAVGKELGRALKVDAVPSFLLFRKGKVYGEPLSITRLPSPKLQLAIDLLQSGQPWDEQALREVDQDKNSRRPPTKNRP
jgi:hypothetical protein